MTEKIVEKRYRIDVFHGKSLEGNPINSPADRGMHVYLPPGYFESEEKKYPVIYFLHGYTGYDQKITVTSTEEDNKNLPVKLLPPYILEQIDLDRWPSYKKFDELIAKGELDPFIFVQPDASLRLPHKDGAKDFSGAVQNKGSLFVNSAFTGNYADYIAKDVIEYVDANYRTIPDKQHRGLAGGSMGGYGALSVPIYHPDKFIATASLSPGNLDLEVLDLKLVVPIHEKVLGREWAEQYGVSLWGDVIDTADLVFSRDNPLWPSIVRDDTGKTIDFNKEAAKNWEKYNINNMIRENPDALKEVFLLLNCEKNDEFGLAAITKRIHETLTELGIDHEFELYSDPRAALSPHILGIGYQIISAIKFCLQHFT